MFIVYTLFVWFDRKQTWLLQRWKLYGKVCKDLRENALKIIDYEKKEIIPLTDEENKSYEKQKVCFIM